VNALQALANIRGYASADRIEYTSHARLRMSQRVVSFADVRHALMKARGCREQDAGTWKVEGVDRSGEELTVIVALEGTVVVVTVF